MFTLPKLNPLRIGLLFAFISGFALFYVLWAFQGFGIQQGYSFTGHSFGFRTLAFGLCNAMVLGPIEVSWQRFLPYHLKAQLVLSSIELLLGSIAIFILFNYFWQFTEWDWPGYTLLLREYSSVMLLPVFLKVFLLLRHRNISKDKPQEKMLFYSDNGKDQLLLKPEDFLYLKSDGNYMELHYRQAEENKVILLRNTLKHFESKYQNSAYLKRSHRSYLVNPTQVNGIVIRKARPSLIVHSIELPLSEQYRSAYEL